MIPRPPPARVPRRLAEHVGIVVALAMLLAACSSTGQSLATDGSSSDVITDSDSDLTVEAESRSLQEPGDRSTPPALARVLEESDDDAFERTESDRLTSTSSVSNAHPSESRVNADPSSTSSANSSSAAATSASSTPSTSSSEPPTTSAATSSTENGDPPRSTAPASTTPTTTTTSTPTPPASEAATTAAPAASAAAHPGRIELPSGIGGVEGIAGDSASGRLFVGDLTNGDIWAGGLDGEPFRRFSSAAASGRANVLGLAVDSSRRRLYAVANTQGRVDVIDAGSGAHIASIPVPGAVSLNDVSVAPDGTTYVSDMGAPRVYRIAAGSTAAELWVDYSGTDAVDTSSRSQHGNGIVADGNSVLVAYMTGGELLRFDRASGAVTRVQHTGSAITGRDGLLLCGNTLLGVDNASFAGGQDTVWVSRLSGDRSSSTAAGTRRSESFTRPTTAAVVGQNLVVVNAQFGVTPKQTPYWLSVLDSPC